MSNSAVDTLRYPMPGATGCPMDPPSGYADLRVDHPVVKAELWDGSRAWLISRYHDVKQVLAHSAASADCRRVGYPWLSEQQRALFSGIDAPMGRVDPPEHTKLRRMLSPKFLVKKAEAHRPAIQELVDGLIDDMLSGPRPVDLVTALGLPVPSTVVSWLLGVPAEDRELFTARNAVLLDENAGPEEALRARKELLAYLDVLVTRRETDPDDDVLSHLVGQYQQGALSRSLLLSQIGLLLAAGIDSTSSMISTGVLTLLRHPEQAAALAADGSLAPSAVEELLRYLTVAEFSPKRVASADFELGGQLIREGDGLICLIGSANHDEGVFPNAGELDITRSAAHHLAFGFGIHHCLGQALARVELQVVYPTLLRRIPDLRLAVPVEKVQYRNTLAVKGVQCLPVTWA